MLSVVAAETDGESKMVQQLACAAARGLDNSFIRLLQPPMHRCGRTLDRAALSLTDPGSGSPKGADEHTLQRR